MMLPTFAPPGLLATTPTLPQASAPAPSGRGMAAKNETSFSRQLEQSRQAHARENARLAPPPKPPAAAASPAPANGQRPTQPKAPEGKESARSSRAAAPRERTAAAQAESAPAETRTESDACAQAHDTGTTDPAIAAPQSAATPPTEPPLAVLPDIAAQAKASAADVAAEPAVLNAAAGPSGPVRPPGQTGERDGTHPPEATTATEPGAWQQAQAAAVLAENSDRSRDLPRLPDLRQTEPTTPSDRTLAVAGFGPSTALAHTAGKAGEVATVNLATPATSAEFRAALGAQVSWFARAGVQQAELHLNPADMGPVSIQIVLDGQQAQVNFGADSALTRQIIESGMPELAGALRDAGLTLTGGGVSQHSGGQRQDGNGNGAAGGSTSRAQPGASTDGSTDPQLEQARRSAVRRSAGGLDVYA